MIEVEIKNRLYKKLREEVENAVIEMIDDIEVGDFLSDMDIKSSISDKLSDRLQNDIDDLLDTVVDEVLDDILN